jgi:putative MATE family efflux protein
LTTAGSATLDAPLLRLSPGVAVWRVAWPMVVLGVLRTGYYLTDSYWVGRLGDDALAGLGGAAFAGWMIHSCAELAGYGLQARVARHEGAGQRGLIPDALGQGLWLGLLVALGLALVGPAGLGGYFDLLGFAAGSVERHHGVSYLLAMLLGAGGMVLMGSVLATYRGLGWTRAALAISGVGLAVNAALDPVLILGLGPAPELGIAGAAWATVVGTALAGVTGLLGLGLVGLRPILPRPRRAEMQLLAGIGAPLTIASIGFSAVYVFLGDIITDYGTAPMAALGIGHRLESVPYWVTVGFGMGASTMVGQNLGAGRPAAAARTASVAAGLCAAAMVPIGVVLATLAPELFDVFAEDPAIVETGATYLRWQSLVWVFMALEVVYEGAFSGSGHTRPALVIGFGGTAARIPLAYALTGPFGIDGVWIAIAATTALKGLLLWGWFQRRTWVRELEPTG